MNKLLREFESSENIEISESEFSWIVQIDHPSGYIFNLDIPKGVFEWFVSVFDKTSNEKIWDDWADIYVDGDITKINQPLYFWADVECFYNKIKSATDFRVVNEVGIKVFGKEFLRSKRLEGKINNEWIQIEPGDLPQNFKLK